MDGAPAGAYYDPDRNPRKRLAESDLALPPALVKGKSSIKVSFRPRGGPWSIGEMRALSHVERPLGGCGKGKVGKGNEVRTLSPGGHRRSPGALR